VSGLLLLEEVLRVWALGSSPASDTPRGWLDIALITAAGLGLSAAAVAAAVGRAVARARAAAAAAAATAAAAAAAAAAGVAAATEATALEVISLAMATPQAEILAVPAPAVPAPAVPAAAGPAAAVMCVHDEVCNCIAAVLGPALVEACFKTNPGSVRPRLVTGNRRALVASISGFLADMVALAGDPRHMALQVTANSTPTLQLRCQIRTGAADGGAPGTAAPTAHWAAIESCYLCPVARRVCGDTRTSQQLASTSTTLSGDYTLNLGPELRTWRHGPATRQHQAALVAWSAVVVVDDDVTMHRWFQHVFLKKPGASAPTPTPTPTATPTPTPTLLTFGDTATFLAAAQAAPRLLDGSVLLFLDLVLPDGDGRDLCHHLRTVCGCEACIVAITSLPATDPTATDAHLAFAGFDAVVRKPVQAAVVAALLRRCGCAPGAPQ
jgi:CheY-like chemotaxis protein